MVPGSGADDGAVPIGEFDKMSSTLSMPIANPGYSTVVVHALAAEQAIADVMTESGDRNGAIGYADRSSTAPNKNRRTPSRPSAERIAWPGLMRRWRPVRARFSDWTEARTAAVRSAAEWKTVSNNPGDSHSVDVEKLETLIAECDRHLP
jgi:hypothetical protein